MYGIFVVLAFASSHVRMMTLFPALYSGDANMVGTKVLAHASPALMRAVEVVSVLVPCMSWASLGMSRL